MNHEIAMKWADALESPEYTQRTHSLRSSPPDQPFCGCVMGVLTDQAVKAGIGQWLHAAGGRCRFSLNHSTSAVSLPAAVHNWAEFKRLDDAGQPYGYVELGRRMAEAFKADSFMEANDDFGVTFPQFAKFIRENWADL